MEAGSLTVTLHPQAASLQADAAVRWDFRVSNQGARSITLTFRTAQRGDVVLERDGVVRYRWSTGRLFAQVLGECSLAPGERWTFSLEGFLEVEPGPYDAIGTVASRPTPPPDRTQIVVEAS